MRCFYVKYKRQGYADKDDVTRYKRKAERDLQKLQAE